MRDARVTALVLFVVVVVGGLVALSIVVSSGGEEPDVVYVQDAGQQAFAGVEVVDEGNPDRATVVRGAGLVDRWVGVESRSDEPLEIRLDRDRVIRAERDGLTTRLGFLEGVRPGAYPRQAPRLSTTIPPGATGLLVLRVRVKRCPQEPVDTEVVTGEADLVRGPDAPRDLRVEVEDIDAAEAGEAPRGNALRLDAPACPGA